MRRRITMLLTVVILMLGATTFAPPALAAPAVPYNESKCVDVGGGYEFCYTNKGVVKANETPSGNTQHHATGQFCFTVTGPGVDEESCSKDNFVFHTNDGETQVSHSNGKQKFAFTSGGTRYECTYTYNATYANGEVRHEDSRFECNPPL